MVPPAPVRVHSQRPLANGHSDNFQNLRVLNKNKNNNMNNNNNNNYYYYCCCCCCSHHSGSNSPLRAGACEPTARLTSFCPPTNHHVEFPAVLHILDRNYPNFSRCWVCTEPIYRPKIPGVSAASRIMSAKQYRPT